MHSQTAQHHSNNHHPAIRAASPDAAPQTLYTVEQLAAVEPAFTASALRNLIFNAQPRKSTKGEIPGNGLIECGAIVRLGARVLINRERFLEWVQVRSAESRKAA